MSDPFPVPKGPPEPIGPVPLPPKATAKKRRSKLKYIPVIIMIIALIFIVSFSIAGDFKNGPQKTVTLQDTVYVYSEVKTVTCTVVQEIVGNVTEYEPITVSTSATYYDSVNGSVVTELQVIVQNNSLSNPC